MKVQVEGCVMFDVSCGVTGCEGGGWSVGVVGLVERKGMWGFGKRKKVRFNPHRSNVSCSCIVLQNQTFFGPNEQLSK